jgi:hypothetical protein
VKDHAKALFAKLAVQGRGALVAKLTGARTPREG